MVVHLIGDLGYLGQQIDSTGESRCFDDPDELALPVIPMRVVGECGMDLLFSEQCWHGGTVTRGVALRRPDSVGWRGCIGTMPVWTWPSPSLPWCPWLPQWAPSPAGLGSRLRSCSQSLVSSVRLSPSSPISS